MSSAEQVLDPGPALAATGPRRPLGHRRLHGSDFTWSLAFVVPYAAVFLAFVVYPIGYGLWMGSNPALYADLLADPRYITTAVNTVLFVGIAVNAQMALSLLLSGFFMRRAAMDQDPADDLHPAVDAAGGARLPLVSLDAGRRPAGFARRIVGGAVRDQRTKLV